MSSDNASPISALPSVPQLSPSIYIFRTHVISYFADFLEERTETAEGGLDPDIGTATASPIWKSFRELIRLLEVLLEVLNADGVSTPSLRLLAELVVDPPIDGPS